MKLVPITLDRPGIKNNQILGGAPRTVLPTTTTTNEERPNSDKIKQFFGDLERELVDTIDEVNAL